MNIEKETFSLTLVNGQKWSIADINGSKEWVEEFARIMCIKREKSIEDSHLLLFNRDGKPEEREDILKSYFDIPNIENLIVRKMRILDLFMDTDKSHMLFNLLPNSKFRYLQMYVAICGIYEKMLDYGAIPFHAALVALNRKGILLAGPSGVGKTTCYKRIPSPWKALCDDEVLLVKTENKEYNVHPFPTWSEYILNDSISDKTWDVQKYFPLKAIFFLRHSNRDKVIPLEKWKSVIVMINLIREIFKERWIGLSKNDELYLKEMLFKNITELVHSVPTYILELELYGKFWEEIEKVIDEENN